MFLAYFQQNYMTILLSLALGVIAYAYHTYTIPARSYIPLIILIILLCSFTYFLNDWIYSCYRSEASMDPSLYVPIRKTLSITNYILLPLPSSPFPEDSLVQDLPRGWSNTLFSLHSDCS